MAQNWPLGVRPGAGVLHQQPHPRFSGSAQLSEPPSRHSTRHGGSFPPLLQRAHLSWTSRRATALLIPISPPPNPWGCGVGSSPARARPHSQLSRLTHSPCPHPSAAWVGSKCINAFGVPQGEGWCWLQLMHSLGKKRCQPREDADWQVWRDEIA